MNLKNKYGEWGIVTGASSGIGAEFARRLAEEKINLIIVARREDRLNKLAEELKAKNNIEVIVAALDLVQEDFIQKLDEKIAGREIGILINNAGYGSTGKFDSAEPKFEVDMVKLNCVAPTILTHHFITGMIERKKGAVIFLGSVLGYFPTPYMSTYSATKAFNKFMGDSLWYEMKKNNVDVLTINPGSTETEFHQVSGFSQSGINRTPANVVTTAMKALGKRPSAVDGTMNKFISYLISRLPIKAQLSIVGAAMQKMKRN